MNLTVESFVHVTQAGIFSPQTARIPYCTLAVSSEHSTARVCLFAQFT